MTTIRFADLASSVAATPLPPTGGGGLGALEDFEKIFSFIDRFLTKMNDFEGQISRLRKMEGTTTEKSEGVAGVVGTDTSEGAPNHVTVLPAPVIDPVAVYGRMLGYLSKLQLEKPEMTVTELLENGKKYKDFIVPEIAGILRDLSNA